MGDVSINTQLSLLVRIRDATDPVAWEEFWDNYGSLVMQFAKRRGCTEQTAMDVAQEVMLEVFQRDAVFHYDPSRGKFRDWLGGMVRNLVGKRRAKPSERVRGEGGLDQSHAVDRAIANQGDCPWDELYDQAVLVALLDVVRQEVSPATYQAFEMVAIQGVSGKQAARATGLSRNAVYQARKRIMRRLCELGAGYREEGQLLASVKHALELRPPARVERAMTSCLEQTMRRMRSTSV